MYDREQKYKNTKIQKYKKTKKRYRTSENKKMSNNITYNNASRVGALDAMLTCEGTRRTTGTHMLRPLSNVWGP
jgi:hypothetical protein